jgi:hypothetical protein
MSKKILLAVISALALGSTSCLGPNHTFNDLGDWNQNVTDSDVANEAIFIGLNVVPVYGLAYFADLVVFNTVIYWKDEE